MAYNDNDEDDQKKPATSSAAQPNSGPTKVPLGGAGATQSTVYPQVRTFQPPQNPQGTPGQQTPMPWSGLSPAFGNVQGRAATPWTQNIQAPVQPQQGQQAAGAPGGMPNWQALLQRFGGGGQQPSPAFQPQRFMPPWAQGGAPQGAPGGAPPWLQQFAQQIAQRGGGFAMPQQGGQGLPIFNIPRNVY